ncbi:hypothetical protein KC669_04250 [Candidatus Dojkabacteria bacterium]|uniref:Glucose-6-phosphate dehydrogenase (NADP(+)) n=1 Tax=Candidatus Dojkabacteria bacterium TaxID=2099670 RepID=A0A955LBI6_9BACT|nr:hypothetical protein [Candidatus Dojkabacteria bacterium]
MTNSSILTIFGATGDLVVKKIIPALYVLFEKSQLPEQIKIVCFARRNFTNGKYNEFINELIHKILKKDKVDSKFHEMFEYVQGDLEDGESYKQLEEVIKRYDKICGKSCTKLFYFSVQPSFYENIAKRIADFDFNNEQYRLLIEKPYGRDYDSAVELDEKLKQYFTEEQIYRIDHYLHKKIVREIPRFRFENSIIKSVWNPSQIKKVVISTKEDFGVEDRGAFYDALGTLKDVGQNHLLAITSLILMDEFKDSMDFLKMRSDALKTIDVPTEEEIKKNTFRAQYEGYKDIEDVKSDSNTETYFKAKLFSTKEGWKNIPFVLEAGKKLDEQKKEVKIYFETNVIFFEFYPSNQVCLGVHSEDKEQCLLKMEDEMTDSQYVAEYTSVISEAIEGKSDYFVCIDEVLYQWKIVDAISNAWQKNIVPLESYMPGTTPETNIN